MRNILILVTSFDKNRKLFNRHIQSYFVDSNDKVVVKNLSELFLSFNGKEFEASIDGKNINEFDLVYFRRIGKGFFQVAGNLGLVLTSLKIKFIDQSWGNIGPSGNKLTSLLRLINAKLPVLPTAYVSKKEKGIYYQRLVELLGSPFVAKDLVKQKGKGVFLIKSQKEFLELKNLTPKHKVNHYLFQKFIEKDKEYRLLVLGEKVAVWEEKIAKKGEFRNNVALGAKEVFLPIDKLPQDLSDLAVKAAKTLNYQVAGVDILRSSETGAYYVLEVNRGPGFTYDATSNEIEELSKYLQLECKRKSD